MLSPAQLSSSNQLPRPVQEPVITDVVVVPLRGNDLVPDEWLGGAAVELLPGLTLERFEDAEAVIEACMSRGLHFDPARQFGELYSFVRRSLPSEPFYTFDSDHVMQDALGLSRLVQVNPHCTQYAARIIDGSRADGERVIAPLPAPDRFYAYVPPTEQAHLDVSQAHELGSLLDRFHAGRHGLPERVRNALWSCEYAAREYFRELASVQVASGLEALIKTEMRSATDQFATRVAGMAADLGIAGVDAKLLRGFYAERSGQVHGDPRPVENETEANHRLGLVHSVLRAAIRRAIEDGDYAAVFAGPESIQRRYPWRRR